jgi:AraC family transcriptional regulator
MAPSALQPGQFYGTSDAKEVSGAILSLVRHATEASLPSHTHALPFLCLLLDGRYRETADEQTIDYEPLTLVYHPARLAHTDWVFPDSRMFVVELAERWHTHLARSGAPVSSLHTHSGAETLWIMLRLLELYRADALTALTVDSLIFELIGSFESLDPTVRAESSPWLGDLRNYLDANFTTSVSIAALAKKFRVHPVHVSRAFRRRYKTNVGDYVHGRRIQQACRMLQSTGESLLSIALELGYFDQSHFNHVFHSFTGTTPSRYRRTARRS